MAAGLLLSVLSEARSWAQERLEIWDLSLGMRASEILDREFTGIACGTNGGPPGRPLNDFEDFAACPAEPTGLHEVYFEYDDEWEYWARAHGYLTEIARFGGTKVMDYQAIVSLLFDDDGVVQGMRIVTDPRADVRERGSAHIQGRYLRSRFGGAGWECTDSPPTEDLRPVGGLFINQRCRKQDEAGNQLRLEVHHFHKPGQTAFDPATRRPQPGELESSTRLEIYAPTIRLDDTG